MRKLFLICVILSAMTFSTHASDVIIVTTAGNHETSFNITDVEQILFTPQSMDISLLSGTKASFATADGWNISFSSEQSGIDTIGKNATSSNITPKTK